MKLYEVAGITRLSDVLPKYTENLKIMLEDKLFFFRNDDRHRQSISSYYDTEMDGEPTTFSIMWQEIPKRDEDRSSVFDRKNGFGSWIDTTWQGFPKRSRSYFASQSRQHTLQFGGGDHNVKLIIPADSIETFGWNGNDFNVGQEARKLHTLIDAMQKLWQEVGFALVASEIVHEDQMLGRLRDWFSSKELYPWMSARFKPEMIQKAVDAMDELLTMKLNPKKGTSDVAFVKMLKSFKEELTEQKFKSIREMLNTITPEAHGSKIIHSLAELPRAPGQDELWFEGSYLAIHWYGSDTVEDLKLILAGKATPKVYKTVKKVKR